MICWLVMSGGRGIRGWGDETFWGDGFIDDSGFLVWGWYAFGVEGDAAGGGLYITPCGV